MSPRRRTVLTVGVLLVIVAAAAALGVWRVLGGAPEEVSLAEAVEDAQRAQDDFEPAGLSDATAPTDVGSDSLSSGVTASDAGGSEDADTDESDSAAGAGTADSNSSESNAPDVAVTATAELDGTWAVDSETGEFTLEDATGSFAGFRVDEELANVGAFTAVGRTGDISGTLEITDERVTSVEITVDLTTLQTDDRRRDSAVQRALGTSQHPTATFVLTEELHIEGAVETGEPVSFAAAGDLRVNGITQPVVVDIKAQLVGSVIAVVGSVELVFADFDVTVPQVPIVLSAEDHGIMEFQLLFERS
ncbi:YceI family protein [Candidatus Poriferisodalis sp.]|uniref:YceI family protein n=1 Tax=Candidatus Poriferisodalis sp. TaxID=3101277 RepID=UPI003B5256AD